MALRCLIVDDNEAFLHAATRLLEGQGLTVVGVASTSADALRLVDDLHPDVVLVDISLGKESGLDLARRLCEPRDCPTVILISTHSEADYADLIKETPAAGFVPKAALSAVAISSLVG